MDVNGQKRQEKTRKLFPAAGLKDFVGSLWTNLWCLERESNSHGRKAHEILSLGCLPVPPSRQVGCFYHIGLNLVNPDEMVKIVSSALRLLIPVWCMDT
jgi:hypothetical protein